MIKTPKYFCINSSHEKNMTLFLFGHFVSFSRVRTLDVQMRQLAHSWNKMYISIEYPDIYIYLKFHKVNNFSIFRSIMWLKSAINMSMSSHSRSLVYGHYKSHIILITDVRLLNIELFSCILHMVCDNSPTLHIVLTIIIIITIETCKYIFHTPNGRQHSRQHSHRNWWHFKEIKATESK